MSEMEQGIPAEGIAPGADPVPTQDERTMATLAHVLQLVGWFIAPLIIFFIKRQSRFVSFHALQVVFLQLIYMALSMVFMAVWMTFIFGMVLTAPKSGPPPLFLIFIPVFWLVWMLLWTGLLITAIVYGIRAGKGEWAEYPVLGRWARRALND